MPGNVVKTLPGEKDKKENGMQGKKLYVGNLGFSVTNEQLQNLFSSHGEVKEVNIIQGKGFGFVEMGDPAQAQSAKEALDGTELEGRTLKVDEARPPKSRPRGGGPRRDRGPKGGYRRY